MLHRYLIALACMMSFGTAVARDTPVHLVLAEVVNGAVASGKIDGSVRFYLEGQHTPAVLETYGEASSNRKTNAFGKSDAEACRWVAMSALIAMQQEAKARGANAVIGITSQFVRRSFVDAEKFECNAGALMAGVAFRGTYAKVAAN